MCVAPGASWQVSVLVYTELFLLTCAWGMLTSIALVLPGWQPRNSFTHYRKYLRSVISPRLALHSTPLVGHFVALKQQTREKLSELSVLFRVLSFVHSR